MEVETNDDKAASARYSVNAVASAMAVFGAVIDRGLISLEAAAIVAGVSRSTAYRLLMTLSELSLVEKSSGGGYQPGSLAYHWAGKLLEQLDVRSIASPTVHRLRDDTGESVNLALLIGSELVYVDSLESPGLLRTVEEVGTSVPIHAAAIGKAVAAFLPPDHLERLLPEEPYPSLGPRTITTLSSLLPQLRDVRGRGFALDIEEVAEGVVCAAAPILVRDRAIGAISISGPRARLSDDRMLVLGARVSAAAHEVSALLDHDEASASAPYPSSG